MYEFEVNPAFLLVLVAGGLALAFDYLPKLRTWFDGLDVSQKRLLNVGLVLGAAVVLFAGDCFGLFMTNLACDIKGGLDTLYMVFLAVTVNQGVHIALRPTPSLKTKLYK
jgi:hypothetical protein